MLENVHEQKGFGFLVQAAKVAGRIAVNEFDMREIRFRQIDRPRGGIDPYGSVFVGKSLDVAAGPTSNIYDDVPASGWDNSLENPANDFPPATKPPVC
jgi:hypothetical protein